MTPDGQRRDQILRHPPPPCHCELMLFQVTRGALCSPPAQLEPMTGRNCPIRRVAVNRERSKLQTRHR
jgi:hypothetical protein